MPLTYERTFIVRHYECDAHGRLHHNAYLQYMQEAAYQASAAAGFDMTAYERSGRRWFVRETQIDYHQPAWYAQEITVRTWVEDFHRVRSIRAYEFTTAGQVIANAWSDWVYLDAATLRPVTVPPEMVRGFVPDWTPQESKPRPRFPAVPSNPRNIFITRRSVDWRDLDPARHVNNTNYLVYAWESGLLALQNHGWTVSRLEEEGVAVAPAQHHIEYRNPALYGDELELQVITTPENAGTITQYNTILRASDHEILARNLTTTRCIWLTDESPCPFPASLLAELGASFPQ